MKKKNDRTGSGAMATAVAVLIIAIVCAVICFFAYTKDDGLIYPNVYIFGQDFSGLTPEEAKAKLSELTADTFPTQTLTVNLPDSVLTFAPADTQVTLDADALAQLAYNYGRGGNRWENTKAKAEAELTSFQPDVKSCMTLNADHIRTVVENAAAQAKSSLTQTAITVTGETPDLNMTYEKAMAQENVAHKQITIVKGTPDRSLNVEALTEAILAAYYANDFSPIDFQYDVTEPDPVDLDALYAQHAVAPIDAVLNESDYSITREVLGYGFDLEALKTQFDAAPEGETISVTLSYVPAAVTWAAIDATLFQDTLGAVSTNHTNDSNRNTNLKLACKAINGKIIRPGETFSYNDTLGQRTEKKGYKPAGAYSAGKSVETIGGGICQVSSTLYYACLKADLEIVERTAHGFMVSYMPYGMDATVSWGTLDYKFKNNTGHPIRIEASVSGGQVHVKLIGTDTKDYTVKMTYETIDGPTEGKVVYEDYSWDNREGYKDGDVIQTAYTGRTVKSYRCKYDKDTGELISKTYEATSRYKSRDKIIARVAPKPVPPTEPTTPTETQPAG